MLRGASLVDGQGVLEAEDVLHDARQFVEALGAGVGVVGDHHGGKLVVAHGVGAAVGQHVEKDFPRRQQERVVADGAQAFEPLGRRKQVDFLHDLDFMHLYRHPPPIG